MASEVVFPTDVAGYAEVTKEDLVARHRKEKKELQAQIQKLKNGVPKGDKKKKKEITEQIAKLETELTLRQDQELSSFTPNEEAAHCNGGGISDTTAILEAQDVQNDTKPSQESTGKKSKAQKRRQARHTHVHLEADLDALDTPLITF
ncbi:OTU domain-containing protein 6B [Elysia marginata]|uniref:OTU domain-containing protein 6B n=1 Tax=Elysia marginata TaxID=1093978 RepID=A0AAV4FLL7_9GAST|nr:OTU domain-containing protein 6B [Elysia marginata]